MRPNAGFPGWCFPSDSSDSWRTSSNWWNVPIVEQHAPLNHRVESCGSRLTTHAKQRRPIPDNDGPKGKQHGKLLEQRESEHMRCSHRFVEIVADRFSRMRRSGCLTPERKPGQV